MLAGGNGVYNWYLWVSHADLEKVSHVMFSAGVRGAMDDIDRVKGPSSLHFGQEVGKDIMPHILIFASLVCQSKILVA